ncbi:MAG TPA: hypothetical protein H9881_06930 [Candidatus Stackebrandtia excrementipullorum]|nr:hypothetical protein [Candidatus Stackebrandtia excrementipullorum]
MQNTRSRLLKRARVAIVAAAAAFALLFTTPGTAWAAGWHAVEGSCYSNGSWYRSDVKRIKSGDGNVTAKFSQVSNGGLNFGYTYTNGSWIGGSSPKVFKTLNTSQLLGSNIYNGSALYAKFSKVTASSYGHDFVGSSYY